MKRVNSCTELPLPYRTWSLTSISSIKSDLKKASGPDGISSRSLAVAGSSASDGLSTVF